MQIMEFERLRCERWSYTVASLVLVVIPVLTGISNSQARGLTPEDATRSESIGRALFSPEGGLVIFERARAYNTGIGSVYGGYLAEQRLSHLYVSDAGPSAGRSVQPLFKQKEEAGYRLYGFSPDGRRLYFSEHIGGIERPGVYSFESRSAKVFDVELALTVFSDPVWVSDEEFVVIADMPSIDKNGITESEKGVGFQRFIRAQMAARESTWRNEAPMVTVLGSGMYLDERSTPGLQQLLKVNAGTGEQTVISENTFHYITASASGRYIAAVLQKNRKPVGADAASEQSRGGKYPLNGDSSLIVYDLQDKSAVTVCDNCQPSIETVIWSTDIDELLYFVHKSGQPVGSGTFNRFDAETDEASTIDISVRFKDVDEEYALQEFFSPYRIEAGWVGSSIILQQQGKDGDRSDWWALASDGEMKNLTAGIGAHPQAVVATAKDAAFFLAGGDLWRAPLFGSPKNLTTDYNSTVRRSRVKRTVGSIYLTNATSVEDLILEGGVLGKTPDLLFLSDDGAEIKQVVRLREGTELLAASQRNVSAVVRNVENGVGVLRTIAANGELTKLTTFNDHLRGVEPGRQVKISYKGLNGDTLNGWLLLPNQNPPETGYPTIVIPYPGMIYGEEWRGAFLDTIDNVNRIISPQIFAGRGYAVLIPSIPLPPAPSDPMIDMWPPVRAAIDEGVRLGHVDPERLAVRGQSGGGYATAALITQTDLFKAAIWSAGFTNLSSFYGERNSFLRHSPASSLPGNSLLGTWSLYLENTGRMGGPPWKDPDRYVKNSPLFKANEINTPLMMIHGELDSVSIEQAEEMFVALARQNKDALLLTYWGEAHDIVSPKNLEDMWRRVFEFLDDHLTPVKSVMDEQGNKSFRSDASVYRKLVHY